MTTTPSSRARRWLLTPFAAVALLVAAPTAGAQEGGGGDNEATAINTEDGGTVFDFALSVRHVANGVIDETNSATAAASCVDCTTVAAAFQVILVTGDADVVVPENLAVAVNSECAECFTYAAATQIVIDADGKQLTAEGHRRLAALQQRMREVERQADEMSEAELHAAVQEAEAELASIFEEELVEKEPGAVGGVGEDGSTTTSTTSTTTTDGATSTSTTEAPPTTEETTTTVAAP